LADRPQQSVVPIFIRDHKRRLGGIGSCVLVPTQYVASFAGEQLVVTVRGIATGFDSCNVVFGQTESRSKGDQDIRPRVITSQFIVPLSIVDRGAMMKARVDPVHFRSGETTYMASMGSASNLIVHQTHYGGDASG
jgi:hypothetical protein